MDNDVVNRPPLERAQLVQYALAEALRRSRLSKRRRRSYDSTSLARRRGALAWAIFVVANFVLVLVAPVVFAVVYFGLLASPQFVSESKFTVQGGEDRHIDGLGLVTGIPSANVVQDTQVVANYIQSRGIVEKLQNTLDLRSRYGAKSIDFIERFSATRPMEKLVDYWKSKSDVSIQLPGGIVTVSVRAFSARDAYEISNAVLQLSEQMVNDMNARMLQDNMASAQGDFEKAATRLRRAQLELERARNSQGILDPNLAGKSLIDLVTGLKGDRLKLQQEYNSQSKAVSRDAPQMKALNARIEAISQQIRALEDRLTGSSAQSTSADKRISESMTKFSELELDRRIAEKQYAAAALGVDQARAKVERRLVYIQTFLHPSLPEQAQYPKRLMDIVVTSLGAFLTWATLLGIGSLVRNHMA